RVASGGAAGSMVTFAYFSYTDMVLMCTKERTPAAADAVKARWIEATLTSKAARTMAGSGSSWLGMTAAMWTTTSEPSTAAATSSGEQASPTTDWRLGRGVGLRSRTRTWWCRASHGTVNVPTKPAPPMIAMSMALSMLARSG